MKIGISIIAFLIIGFNALNAQVPQVKFQVDCFDVPEKAYTDQFGEVNVTINLKCEVNDYKITIYNEWEEVVFESTNAADVWQASKLPKGVYTYVITANMPNTIPIQTLKEEGKITLVR